MRFDGNLARDLLIKCDAAFYSTARLQELVVVSPAPPQALTSRVKDQPGNQD